MSFKPTPKPRAISGTELELIKAEQQITGWIAAHEGQSPSELFDSMGLTAEEWQSLRPEVEDRLPTGFLDDINEWLKEAS